MQRNATVKRMPEATGFEAKTIHRLLEAAPKGGGFKRHSDHPLACALLVVDEPSMVDVLRMPALRRAIPERAARLIVGDIDQLPSGELCLGVHDATRLRNPPRFDTRKRSEKRRFEGNVMEQEL